MDLLLGWKIGAAVAVLVPLLMFGIASLINGREGERRWWWSGEGGGREDRGKGFIIFAYFYMLVLFGLLVWYGIRVLGQPATVSTGFWKNGGVSRSPLILAMLVFGSMTFLCTLLIARFGCNYEEDGNWLSQFGACVTLTFVGIIIFLGIFAALLAKDDTGNDKDWDALAYQRDDNNAEQKAIPQGTAEQRTPRSNNTKKRSCPWWKSLWPFSKQRNTTNVFGCS